MAAVHISALGVVETHSIAATDARKGMHSRTEPHFSLPAWAASRRGINAQSHANESFVRSDTEMSLRHIRCLNRYPLIQPSENCGSVESTAIKKDFWRHFFRRKIR
eukprot:1548844-Pleurochrysis_carterae.AAC.2